MKYIISVLAISLASFKTFAIDRIVQQNGPVGTFASIGAAVTAAVDGDQIIVNNRIDLLPWVENITINKSLTFLCAADNTPFWVEGNYTIAMADNRNIVINGMRNTNGSFALSGSTPTFKTNVSIVQSEIIGNVAFTASGVNLLLSNTKAYNVQFTFGKVLGCDLRNLTMFGDALSSDDVNLIVGNRVGYLYTAVGNTVTLQSTTQYVFFSNNFCYNSNNDDALTVTALKGGSIGNRILNCTLVQAGTNENPSFTSSAVAFRLNFTNGPLLTVENSSFGGIYTTSTVGSNGFLQQNGASNTTLTYNMYYNGYSNSTTPSATLGNFSSFASAYNVNADGSSSSAVTVNAGNPLNDYLDLDLSRNDIGCFGGSYSRENFWPMVNTQSSRVLYVTTPRVVNQGGTVNMTGTGIDE
jgi:hypothetical protein